MVTQGRFSDLYSNISVAFKFHHLPSRQVRCKRLASKFSTSQRRSNDNETTCTDQQDTISTTLKLLRENKLLTNNPDIPENVILQVIQTDTRRNNISPLQTNRMGIL